MEAMLTTFCEELDLNNTHILTELFQNYVLEKSEMRDILNISKSENQISRLLFILKRRGPERKSYFHFRNSLQKEYGYIIPVMDRKYEANSELKEPKLCLYCFIINNLIATDVCQKLCAESVISDLENEAILENGIGKNRHDVCSILKGMSELSVEDQYKAHRGFLSALKSQYKYIYDRIAFCEVDDYTKCSCKDSEKVAGIEGDPKTGRYSERQRSGKEVVRSTPQLEMTMFKDPHFIETGIERIQKTYSSICDTLFRLREECQWAKLNGYKQKLLTNFSYDGDIKILVYISDMIISGYMQKSPKLAMETYHEANKLLPITKLEYWHAVRIRSLQVRYHIILSSSCVTSFIYNYLLLYCL